MKTQVKELYSQNELRSARARVFAVAALCVLIGALTLAFCIFCCVRTEPVNRLRQMVKAIAASTLGGWVVIALRVFLLKKLKNEQKHVEAMLGGEREPVEGSFALSGERLRIINGVGITPVVLTCADGSARRLSLYTKKEKQFNENAVRAGVSQGFIVAYEVEHEGD